MFLRMKLRSTFFALMLAGSALLGGCSDTSEEKSNNDKLIVYTTIFPLQNFASLIGGDKVDVKSIYPPNVDAHSYEPTTKTMLEIADADMFIYTGAGVEGFADKAVETLEKENVKIVKAANGVDLLKSTHDHEHAEGDEAHDHEHAEGEEEHHHHGEYDPHVWLDPIRSIELAENIKDALVELAPTDKELFNENFNDLKGKLETLDQKFSDTVNQASSKEILVSHAAYGYWENRYGIEQLSISGLSPTQEPSQKQLKNMIDVSKEHDLQYVIFDQNVTSKIAGIIQKEIGAKPLTLHNLESVTEDDINNNQDYFSIMEKNIETLSKALNR